MKELWSKTFYASSEKQLIPNVILSSTTVYVKMPFCIAFGCNNQSENNSEVSFHTLPKNLSLRKAWVSAIGRVHIPASGRLCSDHFTPDSYEEQSLLKAQLCPELFQNRKNTRRKLKANAVPSVFSHRHSSTGRETSQNRRKRLEQLEVVFSEHELITIFLIIIL